MARGHARDRELAARAVVAWHQHTDRVPPTLGGEPARCGANAAFELIADHPGAAPDIALGHRTAARAVERGKGVLLGDVEAVDVVQRAVPRLRDDRQRPVELEA